MLAMDVQKKTHNKTILCLLLIAAILLGIFPISDIIYATETKEVKVAFFPMDGYHILDSDGNYDGMDVKYLDAIDDYTNWDISFTECKSWEDALLKLQNKEVDLVGSAQYSEERAEVFDYADLSSGYTFGVIATAPESTIAYEDFVAMQDITYGMVEGYVRKPEFLAYLAENGISNPLIKEYKNTETLQMALDKGLVDAYVHTFTEIKEGQRLIGRFAPRPFYYITYKGNDELLQELNHAISD